MLGDSKVKGSLLNIANQQTEILLKDIRANKNLSDDEVAKLAAEKVVKLLLRNDRVSLYSIFPDS